MRGEGGMDEGRQVGFGCKLQRGIVYFKTKS